MKNENFNKTLSRLAAIQILYAFDLQDILTSDTPNIESTVKDTAQYYNTLHADGKVADKLNIKFLKRLVTFTIEHIEAIDLFINTNLKQNKDGARVSALLKAILRNGVCEMLHFKTPPKITLNEYIRITKDFFGPKEAGFTNALLDKALKLR